MTETKGPVMASDNKANVWKPNINTYFIVGGFVLAIGVGKQNINDHDRRINELERAQDALRAEVNAANSKVLQEIYILGDKIARIETAVEWIQKPIKQRSEIPSGTKVALVP